MSTHTLALDERTYAYLIELGVHEPDHATRLRHITAERSDGRMQISPEQGRFLAWLVRTLGVRRGIEVGTFTGYSALWTASALPDDGVLVCCDIETETTDIGRRFWKEAGVDGRIDLRIAPAEQTLRELLAEGGEGTYDWMFIDADKPGYPTYVELGHRLLRVGGVIAIDNVLWSGAVADPDDHSANTVALRALNASLAEDARWDLSMLPLGDGLSLLRKL